MNDPDTARERIAEAQGDKRFMAALLDRDNRDHVEAVGHWTRLHQAAFAASEPQPAVLTGGPRTEEPQHETTSLTSGRRSKQPKQVRQGTAAGPQFRHMNAYPGGPQGPIVTFYNDDPSLPNTDRPVRSELAEAVEAAALRLGLNVNVNSTRRANSVPHREGRAVDINRINGLRVDDPANRTIVERLQREFMSLPDVNQILGPVYNVDIDPAGGQTPVTEPGVIDQHRNHLHINVRR